MLLQVMSGGFLQTHLMHQLFFGDRRRPKSKVKSPKVHLGEAANKQELCFIFNTCGELLNSAIYRVYTCEILDLLLLHGRAPADAFPPRPETVRVPAAAAVVETLAPEATLIIIVAVKIICAQREVHLPMVELYPQASSRAKQGPPRISRLQMSSTSSSFSSSSSSSPSSSKSKDLPALSIYFVTLISLSFFVQNKSFAAPRSSALTDPRALPLRPEVVAVAAAAAVGEPPAPRAVKVEAGEGGAAPPDPPGGKNCRNIRGFLFFATKRIIPW